eukprot:scaffold19147_cov33-Tisochrysis_lutea.AAC.2
MGEPRTKYKLSCTVRCTQQLLEAGVDPNIRIRLQRASGTLNALRLHLPRAAAFVPLLRHGAHPIAPLERCILLS